MLTFLYSDYMSSSSRKVLEFILKKYYIHKDNSKADSFTSLPPSVPLCRKEKTAYTTSRKQDYNL